MRRFDGIAIAFLPDMYCPVSDAFACRTCLGVPFAVISPPWSPARWHIPRAWLSDALCIHRHEAVNWHERRNPSSRGGMQFLYSTWHGVGGYGDPADATAREQLYRARILWLRDGGSWREWSTARLCGLA